MSTDIGRKPAGGQDKTLPTAQGELPKQKPLIIAFAVIALLVIFSYSIYLWRHGKDDFGLTKDRVVAALEKKDKALLISLAHKDFMVGQPESDNSASVPPEKIMDKIIYLTQTTKWSSNVQEFENVRILYPENGSFQLMFLKTETGWIWAGFLAVNPDDLAALASETPTQPEKFEYKEIQTEEAHGDEPSITD